MKKISTLLAVALVLSLAAPAQSIFDKAKNAVNKSSGGLSQDEAGKGIKAALDKGIGAAVSFLNKKDGFLGNELYKVLLPPEAQKIEKTLRGMGLNKMVDDAIVQINRGAEDAVGSATPIFVDAIKAMSISDALKLVSGDKHAATNYFKEKTTAQLKAAFLPVIKASLEKTNATKYYGDMITKYNSLPTTFNKLNPDLEDYVADRTIFALFDRVALEEENIRNNPAARTSDILKKVFGS